MAGVSPSSIPLPSSLPRKDATTRTHRAELADFELVDGDHACARLDWTLWCSLRWEIVDVPGKGQVRMQVPKRYWIEGADGRELCGLAPALQAAIGQVPALAGYLDLMESRISEETAEEVR